MIDMQLFEQGIRYPVYEWFDDIGKARVFTAIQLIFLILKSNFSSNL